MEFDFIIKIIIYMIIVRIIMSKVNKKKNMRSSNRGNSAPKTSDRQRELRSQRDKTGREQGKKNHSLNIEIKNFKDMMAKPDKSLSAEERMKQREKELENMNKR
jgi:hypothetical protein